MYHAEQGNATPKMQLNIADFLVPMFQEISADSPGITCQADSKVLISLGPLCNCFTQQE